VIGVTLALASVCIIARTWTRVAVVIALLAYAQLGHLFDPGDKGIDRIIRTALVVLAVSPVPGSVGRIPRWPVTVIRGLLVLIYLQAGLTKLFATAQWWAPTGIPELYTILADPLAGRLDPTWWWEQWWPFRLGGVVTLLIELTAPLILTQ
jgi:hypothetical protein